MSHQTLFRAPVTGALNGKVADAARERVLESVRRDQVELVRFLWVDHNGVTRGKAVAAGALAERMISGVGLAKVRQAASLSDVGSPVAGYDAVGEVRLLPDPRSYVLLPHAPGTAAMICDLVTVDGEPWAACPRTFLRDAVLSAADLGIMAAFEPEFTLCAGPPAPAGLELYDTSLCFDNEGFDATNDFAVELTRNLNSQGLQVQTYHPEFAPGQHELTLRHTTALRAADQFVWQRVLTRGLARRHGMWATFAPVPQPGLRGNGNHVHLSAWRTTSAGELVTNLFADPDDPLGLSTLARHFIGGLLAHLPGLTALTCASVNSYDRLRPGMWAGACAGYGFDNREAAIRIPSRLRGAEEASTNVEVKSCDATANPYLALGALIQAGLDGIRRRLDPGEPLEADPSKARARPPGPGLPASLADAIDALESDEYLMTVLGPERRALYPAIKRADIRELAGLDPENICHKYALHY